MELKINTKDQKITIQSIHMVKKTLKFTKKCKNRITNKNYIPKIQKEQIHSSNI